MKLQSVSLALVAALAAPALAAPEGKPVKLEDIAGSAVKRITLTQKAAIRLGIETGKVSEELIVRRQMVGGLVVAASQVRQQPEEQAASGGFGGFVRQASAPVAQPAAAAGGSAPEKDRSVEKGAWLLVTLSPAEWERLAKDKPARLLPLATRDGMSKEIAARPSGLAPVADGKRSMLHLYYVVPGADHGLELSKRMRVELQLNGSDQKRKVVPYSSVYYDPKGNPWVYVNPEPLVFHRQRIDVERIDGNFAVLKDGPPVGATVVTVGAPLLYGTEIFKK